MESPRDPRGGGGRVIARGGRVPAVDRRDPTIRWLLEPEEPAVRYLALVHLLGKAAGAEEVREARARIPGGPWGRALLAGQREDGGFGVNPYRKWTGAHWRLVSLVELGIAPEDPRARRAAETVLAWLDPLVLRSPPAVLRGRVRRCASIYGNALAVASRLGMAGDPRAARLAEGIAAWQWPDGGWNCDRDPRAHHSSFYESLATMWGLAEYHRATGDGAALAAARRAADLFLRHRLFRSEGTGQVIDPRWLDLHYPLYWHYDVLQALLRLSLLVPLKGPRVREALDVVQGKRDADGRWRAEGCYWRPPGRASSCVEAVDWGRRGPSKMVTLNALRVLRVAGRL